MEQIVLPFQDLATRHHGVTPAIASGYAEAARVCLDRHHASPIVMRIHGPDEADDQPAVAVWVPCDERTLAAWANDTDATAAGAYGIALAAVEIVTSLVAVHRAETGTGADYYISRPDEPTEDLENAYRLEVSGVDHGVEADVRARLRMKIKQAIEGNSNLPALAAVVGFRARIVAVAHAVRA